MIEECKRRRRTEDTERQAAKRSCAAHLRDLRAAHASAPADVDLPRVAIPARLDPVPTASWCTSPAQLCAELAE